MIDQAPEPTLPLNSTFGPYHLSKLIAVGGMAEIYLARTKGIAGFEKQLALKVIHRDYADDSRFVQMLIDEAKLSVKLNHPNIVQTFDLGQIERVYFISMEHVDGADFFQILKGLSDRDEALPVSVALQAARDVCRGLEYAHTLHDADGAPLQVIHRDISPQNILLSRRGEVKLVDFGIAKAANVSRKTRAGVIKGKLVYMSPEQSWGEEVDQRTDIFSAGIVLYEALTGGSLYREQNPVKLLKLVRKAEIRPPSSRRPDVTAEVDALVMKALHPKPDDRYQTAGEMGDAIERVIREGGLASTPSYVGSLVAALVDGGPLPRLEATDRSQRKRRASNALANAMSREDYGAHAHSVIFSAEDMMLGDISGRRGAARPASGAAPAQASPSGPSAAPAAQGAPSAPPAPPPPPAAPRPKAHSAARLMLLQDSGVEEYDLGEQFIIGRSGNLRLANGRVSRRHARIVHHEGKYLLEDLQSSNGTFLNNEKVSQICQLKSQDQIRIGPFEMRVVFDATSQPSAPAAAPPPPPMGARPNTASLLQGELSQPPDWVSNITPSEASAAQAAELASAPPAAAHGEDWTLPHQRANLVLELGDERLVISVESKLHLDHCLILGGQRIEGPASRIVRQGQHIFVEPAKVGREPVQVNGHPVSQTTRLKHGDVIDIGPLRATFEQK